MFNHQFGDKVGVKVLFHWFLMSFAGGAINAGGFLATGRFVSHVTGFATLFGVDINNYQFEAAFGILSVPLFFFLGAFIAGILIDKPVFEGKRPRFDLVMGISAFCLFISSASGEILRDSIFGDRIELNQSYLLLALLCMACGLQNAAITSSSKSSVRTTHLTGLTTDLGLGLARMYTLTADKKSASQELRLNSWRIGSILSFIFGSAVGATVFLHFGYRGFLLPAVIAVYAAWHGRLQIKSET